MSGGKFLEVVRNFNFHLSVGAIPLGQIINSAIEGEREVELQNVISRR